MIEIGLRIRNPILIIRYTFGVHLLYTWYEPVMNPSRTRNCKLIARYKHFNIFDNLFE